MNLVGIIPLPDLRWPQDSYITLAEIPFVHCHFRWRNWQVETMGSHGLSLCRVFLTSALAIPKSMNHSCREGILHMLRLPTRKPQTSIAWCNASLRLMVTCIRGLSPFSVNLIISVDNGFLWLIQLWEHALCLSAEVSLLPLLYPLPNGEYTIARILEDKKEKFIWLTSGLMLIYLW